MGHDHNSMMRSLAVGTLCLLATACAADGALDASDPPPRAESVVPGTIHLAVEPQAGSIVVAAVREGSAAAREHVAPGDRLVRLEGQPIGDAREFERRVLGTPPGSSVRVEVVHDGKARRVELPVEEIALDERG
jgi:S1-C subfamily serine protease